MVMPPVPAKAETGIVAMAITQGSEMAASKRCKNKVPSESAAQLAASGPRHRMRFNTTVSINAH